MPIAIAGHTLKQFFDDERWWTGHESYDGVSFAFDNGQDFADPLTIPDAVRCQVSGGHYRVPGQPPRPFEPLLQAWLDALPSARIDAVLPREAAEALAAWWATRGLPPLPMVPCR